MGFIPANPEQRQVGLPGQVPGLPRLLQGSTLTSWSPWAGARPAAPSAGVHTQLLCHYALPLLALLLA